MFPKGPFAPRYFTKSYWPGGTTTPPVGTGGGRKRKQPQPRAGRIPDWVQEEEEFIVLFL